MALDESVFANYQAAQGDFGAVPGIVPQGIPQTPQTPQIPVGGPQVAQAPQAPQSDIQALQGHPLVQAFGAWKTASTAKREEGSKKLFEQFGPVKGVIGADPTEDAVAEAWMQKKAVEDRKAGKETKEKPPKNTWNKFMKYLDDNPQFLLDLGSSLLAPRSAGVSDLSHIASGLSGAVGRLGARKAATQKGALATRKAQADIASTQADVGKVPSEIELNKARAEAARRGKTPAGKAQRTKNYADALRVQFPDLFPDASSALLAAEGQLSGKSKQRDKFLSDFTKDNLIFFDNDPVAAAQAAELAADTLGLPKTQSLESMEAGQRAAAVKKDPNLLYDYLAKTYPQATHEQIQAKVKQTAGKEATRKAPKPAKAKAPEQVRALAPAVAPVAAAAPVTTPTKDKRQMGAQERRAYMVGIANRSKEELQAYLAANKKALSSTQRIKLRRAIKNK